MAAVTICSDFRAPKEEICHCFYPSICHEVMGPDAIILVFWMLSFKSAFHSPLSLSSRGSLAPLCFLPIEWYHLHIWGCWRFSRLSGFQVVTHADGTMYRTAGWFKMRKEFDRAVCCHPVCLIYVLSTSWEMLGWMSYTGTINAVILGFWFC